MGLDTRRPSPLQSPHFQHHVVGWPEEFICIFLFCSPKKPVCLKIIIRFSSLRNDLWLVLVFCGYFWAMVRYPPPILAPFIRFYCLVPLWLTFFLA